VTDGGMSAAATSRHSLIRKLKVAQAFGWKNKKEMLIRAEESWQPGNYILLGGIFSFHGMLVIHYRVLDLHSDAFAP